MGVRLIEEPGWSERVVLRGRLSVKSMSMVRNHWKQQLVKQASTVVTPLTVVKGFLESVDGTDRGSTLPVTPTHPVTSVFYAWDEALLPRQPPPSVVSARLRGLRNPESLAPSDHRMR